MSLVTTSKSETKKRRFNWRTIIFVIVAVFFMIEVAQLLSTPFDLLGPWFSIDPAGAVYHPQLHLWHDAQDGVLHGIIWGGCIIALLWRRREKPLLMQFVILGTAIEFLFLLFSVHDNFELPIAIVISNCLLIATYPAPRSLLSFLREGALSNPSLILTLLAIVPLSFDVWRNLSLQLAGLGGEHFTANHWLISMNLSVVLILAGMLASTKRPGWQVLGFITGAAFIYLGMAALRVPDQAGSWGILGGLLSLLGGLGYIAATLFELRRMRMLRQVPSEGFEVSSTPV